MILQNFIKMERLRKIKDTRDKTGDIINKLSFGY